MLASRFASHSPALRSDYPLSDDQIRRVAPSIFADAPHESRSERYSYILCRRRSNLSHRADRILSQGWGPAFRGPAVDKCRSVLAL
jgi:hypothetical protein